MIHFLSYYPKCADGDPSKRDSELGGQQMVRAPHGPSAGLT